MIVLCLVGEMFVTKHNKMLFIVMQCNCNTRSYRRKWKSVIINYRVYYNYNCDLIMPFTFNRSSKVLRSTICNCYRSHVLETSSKGFVPALKTDLCVQ